MGAFATMTSKGQLTIPKEVRDELNLTAGTRFYVLVHNGDVVPARFRPCSVRLALQRAASTPVERVGPARRR